MKTRGGLFCGGGADNGDKSGFHAVELFEKVASMPWKTAQFGFHGVENRRIRLPCRETFPGAGKRRLPLPGAQERRPAAAWTSFPNPAASKAPSTSSSASSPPRQRQQPLNPVGARNLPPPPLIIAHWNWQHFPIGNIKNEFLAPKRAAARESRRFPLFHAWAEVCNLSGDGVIFRHAMCNQGKEGTT